MRLFKNLPKELLVLKIIVTVISLIIWVIFLSIIYSIGIPGKFDVKLSGEGDLSWHKEGDFLVASTEISIVNNGLWDIKNLNLKIDIKNQTNYYIIHYTKTVDKIPHGKETPIPITVRLDLEKLYNSVGDYWAINDQDLEVEIYVTTNYAKSLIKFSTNFVQHSQWGAPLSGLNIKEPNIEGNYINTSFNFFNNASYDLNLNVSVFDEDDNPIPPPKQIFASKKHQHDDWIKIDTKSINGLEYVKFFFSDEENFIKYGPIIKKIGGY